MRRFGCAALALLVTLGFPAGAAELSVPGLGAFPFSEETTVTDGGGTAVEQMLQRGMTQPQQRGTKRQELMRFLAVPEGMRLSDGTENSPAGRARVWQLVQREERATYTMMAFSFSGDAAEIFPKDKKRAAFWERAFEKGEESPRYSDVPMITLDEFRAAAKAAMNRGEGEAVDFRILSASPWKRYGNDDGTFRWQQQVKFTVTNPEGFVMPMWLEGALFRNAAGRFYFLIFMGSHESGRVMADDILVALYRLEREEAVGS